MLWIFLALIGIDLASTDVSVPAWGYILLIIVGVVFVCLDTMASKR